jgi:diguanylate cyclase (GGDEF)-like protein
VLETVKIIFYIILFISAYILLPVYLTCQLEALSIKTLLTYFLINIIIVLYLARKYLDKKYTIRYQVQEIQEKINIFNNLKNKEQKNNSALIVKIKRYDTLRTAIQEINESLDLDDVASHLSTIAFSLISENKGTCILYLVDNRTQKLNLFKAKKEDSGLIIKAKEGDIFDHWVMRHASPLLVEEVGKDFRFDAEKLKKHDLRPFSSLISSPFLSDHKLLGLLRLDHPKPYFYSQDDLRFLVAISGLGAVALENSMLFQETQALAIHDGLTALFTKEYFLERLKEECIRSMRTGNEFCLLMLDIDFFKNYNDKFGHAAGDIVLKALSRNINESLKELNPIVSRFGGEEFCIILPGINKKRGAATAAKLCKNIEKEKIILRRNQTHITVSIGVAGFPDDSRDEDGLIIKADHAMYEAKQKGRNRVCCI